MIRRAVLGAAVAFLHVGAAHASTREERFAVIKAETDRAVQDAVADPNRVMDILVQTSGVVPFAHGSDEVPENCWRDLGRVAVRLRIYPQSRASIEGHISTREHAELDVIRCIALKGRRAAAVSGTLRALGVPPGQLGAVQNGESRPPETGERNLFRDDGAASIALVAGAASDT